MKIGITGPNGRLGSYLVRIGCEPIYTDVMDLTTQDVSQYDVIINCAAETGVDACQSPNGQQTDYYKEAVQVNVRAVNHLRITYPGRLIHLSTDYVFKGDKGPYKEEDDRDPVNDYGFTKYGGEVVLETLENGGQTIIVRTTGLFGNGRDFAASVIDKLREGETVMAANDLIGNHTYIPHLCEALMQLAGIPLPHPVTYLHVASREVMSRFYFSLNLAFALGLNHSLIFSCEAKSIATWTAPRPTKGGLVVLRADALGLPLYTTKQGIDAYVESMK